MEKRINFSKNQAVYMLVVILGSNVISLGIVTYDNVGGERMISSILLQDIPPYGQSNNVLNDLSIVNFVYGANGSGKTTISRVIADPGKYPSCNVTWRDGLPLETMVYNRDFVKKNFFDQVDLPGVFTLGEQNIDTLTQINNARTYLTELTKKIIGMRTTMQGEDGKGGKVAELDALNLEFRETCWKQKVKYDPSFAGAFEGLRNNKENFKNRVLQENANNVQTLEIFETLQKKAKSVFGSVKTILKTLPAVDASELTEYETDPILQKCVIGKNDVDIAAMINKLGNSDWVQQGIEYLSQNEGICPFCQQPIRDSFYKSLSDYFDETFEKDNLALNKIETAYKHNAEHALQQIDEILQNPSEFLDTAKIVTEQEKLKIKIAANIDKIGAKRREPSRIILLESTVDEIRKIRATLEDANVKITEHNNLVNNIVQERNKLTSKIWKYIIEIELMAELQKYLRNKQNLQRAIANLQGKIGLAEREMAEKEGELHQLEAKTTSIEPTINAINALLKSFGFFSFSIVKAAGGKCYKLQRRNGSDAKETLSEGEVSFVTFLYFYHLLKGSLSASGTTKERIVVFDDPVSSLDSDVLFIVSSLIKELFEESRNGQGNIKQIFILTHNVYFHKEVSFHKARKGITSETFWIVRKKDTESTLKKYMDNPIKTSYQLLWEDLKQSDYSKPTLQNTMRRILEYYFTILGGRSFDSICEGFVGREKMICHSLVAWAHAGSHALQDELYISLDAETIDSYIKVFFKIFENEHQLDHLKMMVGDKCFNEMEITVQSERGNAEMTRTEETLQGQDIQ